MDHGRSVSAWRRSAAKPSGARSRPNPRARAPGCDRHVGVIPQACRRASCAPAPRRRRRPDARCLAKAPRVRGFEVVDARNGVEALARFDAVEVDIVVTDIFMPEKDGIELIQDLRLRRPTLPIVAINGSDRRDTTGLEVSVKLGAGASLRKPFTADDFLAAIE
jgi:CheY-like chemotaxis protein